MSVRNTQVNQLIINQLTKAQYQGISNPSNTEIYLVDENEGSVLNDAMLVHLSGAETITGAKTFTGDTTVNRVIVSTIRFNNQDVNVQSQRLYFDNHALAYLSEIPTDFYTRAQVDAKFTNVITTDNVSNTFITRAELSDIVALSGLSSAVNSKQDKERALIINENASGTIALTDNAVYSLCITGATSFTLPTIFDNTKLHRIEIQLSISSTGSINNYGTNYVTDWVTPEATYTYMLVYEYHKYTGNWMLSCKQIKTVTGALLTCDVACAEEEPTSERSDDNGRIDD